MPNRVAAIIPPITPVPTARRLAAPAPLNLVCFRHTGGDDANRRLLEHVNRSGELYMTHTVLDGRYTLRLCIGQTHTEARHVEAAWRKINEAAEVIGG